MSKNHLTLYEHILLLLMKSIDKDQYTFLKFYNKRLDPIY